MPPSGSVSSTRASAVRDAVASLSQLSLAPAEFLHQVDQRIRTVIECEANHWWTVDPETILPTDLGDSDLELRAENVFDGDDYRTFDRLDREGSEAQAEGSGLWLASRSGGATWTVGRFVRAPEDPAFTEAEAQYIAVIGGLVAAGVRAYLAGAPWVPGDSPVPGLISVDAEERILDATPEGVDWLNRWGVDIDGPLPRPLRGLVRQTRDRQVGAPPLRPAKVRARFADGTWVVARANRFAREEGHTAILLKAATRADLRSFYLSVRGLTERERQLTELLIGGKGLQEIAIELDLSIHTVRSHVKAIFAKVEVSSRAELTAALA